MEPTPVQSALTEILSAVSSLAGKFLTGPLVYVVGLTIVSAVAGMIASNIGRSRRRRR